MFHVTCLIVGEALNIFLNGNIKTSYSFGLTTTMAYVVLNFLMSIILNLPSFPKSIAKKWFKMGGEQNTDFFPF